MTTQTLNRADYCYSEASELLNLSTATIIDMVNNGTLEHTACGKRITRDSLQAAMAPESEEKWLHGEKSDGWIKEAGTTSKKGQCVPQPQPGEWWEYSLKGLRGVAYCCGRFLNGRLLWQDHPNRGYIKLFRQSLIRHLPDCTGFDYELPPEETPAERRLREVGLEEHNGDYLKPTGKVGVTYSISWRHWTAKQVEAIAAHMREQIGGAE